MIGAARVPPAPSPDVRSAAIPPTLARIIAGSASVDRDRLRRRLGATTYLVWTLLCARREERTGTLLMAARDLERNGIKYEMAEDALRRLKRAGLVVAIGWRRVSTRHGEELMFIRRVLGCPPYIVTSGRCAIPRETLLWLATASGRGGARIGAGRKRSIKAPEGSIKVTRGVEFKAPDPFLHSQSLRLVHSPSENEGGAVAPRVPLRGETGQEHTVRAPPIVTSTRRPHAEVVRQAEEHARRDPVTEGTIGPVRSRPARLHAVAMGECHPAVPRPVSVFALAPVMVPNPPLLDPHDIPGRKAYLLQRWFEGAVEVRTKKRCWSFRAERAGHITQSKYFDLLTKAAAVFIEHDIAPAAWCAFSVDVWRENNKGAPPIAWVFAAKRIEERRGWFRSVSSDYSGGRVLYSEAGRELMQRQAKLERVLRTLPPEASDAQVAACAASVLSVDEHVRLVADVLKSAKQMNEDLAAKVFVGEWVW